MDGGIQERTQASARKGLAVDLFRAVKSNRNRLFGLWVAAQLGLAGASAEIYAAEIAAFDFSHPGDGPMLTMAARDLKSAGVRIRECELLNRLTYAELQARHLILGED